MVHGSRSDLIKVDTVVGCGASRYNRISLQSDPIMYVRARVWSQTTSPNDPRSEVHSHFIQSIASDTVLQAIPVDPALPDCSCGAQSGTGSWSESHIRSPARDSLAISLCLGQRLGGEPLSEWIRARQRRGAGSGTYTPQLNAPVHDAMAHGHTAKVAATILQLSGRPRSR